MGAACGTPFAETAILIPLSTMCGALQSRVRIMQDISRCADNRCCSAHELARALHAS